MEVVVQQSRLVRQHRQRRIRSHGTDGFYPVLGHGLEQHPEFFKAIAEGFLADGERGDGGMGWWGGGVVAVPTIPQSRNLTIHFRQICQLHPILIQPLPIGLGRGDFLLDFLVGDNPAFVHVDQEHATGFEATFVGDVFGFNGEDSRFGGHDYQVVLRHGVAGGAQTVAGRGLRPSWCRR